MCLLFLFRKVFDATAGPFPFLPAKVYHFASERFVDATAPVQDQVLSWLEVSFLMLSDILDYSNWKVFE